MQCCGTGTAGTVTFCYKSDSGTGFGIGSNIIWNKKSQKREANFLEIMLLLAWKRQDFVQVFCC
jgi:hypothetical protein